MQILFVPHQLSHTLFFFFSCACPIPGRVQGKAGWGFEEPGLVKGVPAHSSGVRTRQSLRSPPTQTLPWFYDLHTSNLPYDTGAHWAQSGSMAQQGAERLKTSSLISTSSSTFGDSAAQRT